MTVIPKNKPEKSAMKILRLFYENPGIGLPDLLKISGFTASNLGRITQNLRGIGNLCLRQIEGQKTKRGYYQLTAKGEAVLGIKNPPRAAYPSGYTKFTAIEMISHRHGAGDAQAIARRGQAC